MAEEEPQTLQVMGRAGSYQEGKMPQNPLHTPLSDRAHFLLSYMSPSGRAVLKSDQNLIIENVFTGEQKVYPLDHLTVQAADWTVDGRRALVTATDKPCPADCKQHVFLLSIDSDTLQPVVSYTQITDAVWSP